MWILVEPSGRVAQTVATQEATFPVRPDLQWHEVPDAPTQKIDGKDQVIAVEQDCTFKNGVLTERPCRNAERKIVRVEVVNVEAAQG